MIQFLLRTILVAVACLLATSHYATAGVSIIYQPLLAHMAIDDGTWPTLFKQLRRTGIDTLVFQWTRHNDAFTIGDEAAWLEKRAQDAVDAGLGLMIGLSTDGDIFQRLEQPASILPPYFRKIREKDRALVSQWQRLVPADRLIGWYLPLEIDDKRWRKDADQAVLVEYLKHTSSEIAALETTARPIVISSFFTGQMSPRRYAELTRKIHDQSGVHVWVQDGTGIGTLTATERQLYLNELTLCRGKKSPAVQGVIFELFKQAKHDTTSFKALPLSTADKSKALLMRAPCGLDTSYFGLNYWSPVFEMPKPEKP